MSIFGSIMSKIFSVADGPVRSAVATPSVEPATATAPSSAPAGPAAASPQASPKPVDVEAILTQMASGKGGGGNWKTSIVDLLKLLDLDSSLSARKELATELNVPGEDGSAEKNMALHKAVMQKLAENGGKVPASMKD